MTIYMCSDCRNGFDIEISGGIRCPECGGKRWQPVNRLPNFATKYREDWAKKYGIVILNEDEKAEDYPEYQGG
tara:strand:- start:733 stop:951 length:219 start_codon:yes stop_codon:yes gene_type:complete